MKPPTILVIEDNPLSLKMTRIALESEGYRVVTAADASTGWQAAKEEAPDLILQDLILPDMDGFELLEKLRALPKAAGIPIIALSGLLSETERSEGLKRGLTDYFIKPMEPSLLVQSVGKHLKI